MGSLFANVFKLFNFLLRRPSLVREVKRRDRVSYPFRSYRNGTLVVRLRPDPIVAQAWRQIKSGETEPGGFDCEPEVERGIQRGYDRVFQEYYQDIAYLARDDRVFPPGPGDADEE